MGNTWKPDVSGLCGLAKHRFNFRNWSKLVEIGRNWSKLVEIGRNWSKLVEIGRFWAPGFAQDRFGPMINIALGE